MDKIAKILQKMTAKERKALLMVLLQIKNAHSKVPGIIKLTHRKDHFRVRVGNYRIIFHISKNTFEVIRISIRNENTYKNLQ